MNRDIMKYQPFNYIQNISEVCFLKIDFSGHYKAENFDSIPKFKYQRVSCDLSLIDGYLKSRNIFP
jgi:hypothetical protein